MANQHFFAKTKGSEHQTNHLRPLHPALGDPGQLLLVDTLILRQWPLDTQEFTYNILYQEADTNLMPTLKEQNMGTIIKRPISNAVWQQKEQPEGGFMGGPWERAQQFPLEELAGDMPLIEFALRFTLSHPDVCTAIVGTTNPDHIAANVGISDGQSLPDEIVQKARDVFKEKFGSQ